MRVYLRLWQMLVSDYQIKTVEELTLAMAHHLNQKVHCSSIRADNLRTTFNITTPF
jgi:hypothetical protein